MRMMIRRSFCSIVLALTLFLISGHAQGPEAASPAASATIAAKKPVFAGACKACPWGILARVTADALSYYGYQTTICWVCWSSLASFGPREMGDKTKPVKPPGAESNAEYIEPPPDAVPDIGATSESNLIDARIRIQLRSNSVSTSTRLRLQPVHPHTSDTPDTSISAYCVLPPWP